MTTKTHTLNVRGMKVRTRTLRRYVVVAVRDRVVQEEYAGGGLYTYEPYVRVVKRTDSLAYARKFGGYLGTGLVHVVVDTTTGEEV